jgi:preprotein translocase subunit SecB
MSASPLSLVNYFYTSIEIRANENITEEDLEKRTPFGADVEVQVACGHADGSETDFMVSLTIELTARVGHLQSYYGTLSMTGFFTIDPRFPADEREKLLSIAGPSILYSSARDFIQTITSRGPWPALMLPTISFKANGAPANGKEPSSPPKAKSKRTKKMT